MQKSEMILVLVSLLAIATCVFANDSRAPLYCQDPYSQQWYVCGQTNDAVGENGLPLHVNDETQFYAYDYSTKKFHAVTKAQQLPDHFYVRFAFPLNRWIWVTGLDPRAVTGGSKIQGKRLGMPITESDRRGLDWYILKDDWAAWSKVTDLKRPTIYRRDWNGQIVVGEVYPDNWQSFGGQLDGQPTNLDKPSCNLIPNPPTVKAHQPLLLHLSTIGQVTGATIDGQKVNLIKENGATYAQIMVLPTTPGFYTVQGTVKGPNGDAACEVPYAVDPAEPKK